MDLIDRQAAIDALINHEPTSTLAIINVIDKDIARAIIEDLPSAQPEIIRCKDCKHYNAGFECLIEGYGIERDEDWYCADAERKIMFKVPNGQDPYSAIGKYIRDHITAIEDIIAVINIDGVETNELFMVDMQEDGYFVWKSDWWEGEKDIALIDFFPVSEAEKPAAQPEQSSFSCGHEDDLISRQAAIDTANDWLLDCFKVQKQDRSCGLIRRLEDLPSAHPEQKKGRWIKKMLVTETEKYTSYDPEWYCACCGAKYDPHIAKIVNFCYVCGADMRGEQDE